MKKLDHVTYIGFLEFKNNIDGNFLYAIVIVHLHYGRSSYSTYQTGSPMCQSTKTVLAVWDGMSGYGNGTLSDL